MDCVHPLPPEGLYVRQNARGVQYWDLTLQGDTVTTYTGRDPHALRPRSRTFPTADKATKYADTARCKKMREGYLFRRTQAAPGQVVVRALLPHSQQHDFFDVHPDGTRLLVSAEQRPANHNAWLYELDLATAHTRQVFHDDGAWTSAPQTFTHCALYQGPGHALFSVNGRTWCVDLDSGQATPQASYNDKHHSSHFNSHCVRSQRTPDHSRFLLFDQGDVARVVDAQGVDLQSFLLSSEHGECIAGALSSAGQRAVFCFCTGAGTNAYRHTVETYDVASGQKIASFVPKVPDRISRVRFGPDASCLVFKTWGHDLIKHVHSQTGASVLAPTHWDGARSWAWSPDGDILAVGHTGLTLYKEGKLLHTLDTGWPHWGINRLVFSPQADILYAGLTGGEIVGWKL